MLPVNDVGSIMSIFVLKYNVGFGFFFKKAKYVRFVANDHHMVQLDINKSLIPNSGCQLFQFLFPIVVLQLTPDTW